MWAVLRENPIKPISFSSGQQNKRSGFEKYFPRLGIWRPSSHNLDVWIHLLCLETNIKSLGYKSNQPESWNPAQVYWILSKNHNHNTFMTLPPSYTSSIAPSLRLPSPSRLFQNVLAPESPPSPSISTSSSSSLQGVPKKVPFSISGLCSDYGCLLDSTL